MGELAVKDIAMIPMAIDPHGQMGPLMMRFLYGRTRGKLRAFKEKNSNAVEMYRRITSVPCPSGIIQQATINWKKNKTTQFFGSSYSPDTR